MSKIIKPPSYRTQLALPRGTNRGLELNWIINEHQTTTLYDSSRHGRNGALTDVVAYGRLDLDGSTALATVARIADLTDFTAWIQWNPDDITSIRSPLMRMGDFIIDQVDDDIVAGKTTVGYSEITTTAAAVLTVGARHDIFLTRIGNDYTLYVFDANGALTAATFTNSDAVLSTLTNLIIGSDSRTAFVFPALTPANLTSEKAIVINASDNVQISSGSPSLNNPATAENLNSAQGTWEVWFKSNWNSGDGMTRFFVNVGPATGTPNRMFLWIASDSLAFGIVDKDNGSHSVTISTASLFSADTWVHLVATWDLKNDAMALYVDAVLKDDAGHGLSSDSLDDLPSTIDIGHRDAGSTINGSLKYHLRNRPLTAAEVTALYNSGDGHLDTMVVGPDTVAFDQFTDESTGVTYHPRQQKIDSISTVTLTMSIAADGSLVAGEEVVVYDDSDPANVVYTTVATVSGTTVTVDDSCAAVTGTNKTITRNLFVDGGFESAGVANITVGANQTVTKDSSVVKFDGQSLKDVYAAADDNDESTIATMTLVSSNDYSARLWIRPDEMHDNSTIHIDIDGSATPILTREIGKSLDDRGNFARSFDLGTANRYAVAANNTIHDIGLQDWGMWAWVRLPADTDSGQHYIGGKFEQATEDGYTFDTIAGLTQGFMREGANHEYRIFGNTDIRDGKWHFVAIIIDRDNIANCKVYLDGSEDGTTNKIGALADVDSITNAGVFNLGRRGDGTSAAKNFPGEIAEWGIAYPADIMAVGEMGEAGAILDMFNNPSDLTQYPNFEDGWGCDDNAANTTVVGAVNNLTASANTEDFATLVWKYYEMSFTADQAAITANLRIDGAGAGANSATVYLDQAEILEQLKIDPGQEGNFTAGLNDFWGKVGALTVAEEASIVHSGSKSQKGTHASQGGNVFQTTTVVAGAYYTASAWVRSNSDKIVLGLGDSSSAALAEVAVAHSGGDTFELLRVTLKASDTSKRITIGASEPTTAVWYADDVTLVWLDARAAPTANRVRDFADGKVEGVAVWNRGMNATEVKRKRDFVYEGGK